MKRFWFVVFTFFTLTLAQQASPFGQPPEALGTLMVGEEQNGVRAFEVRLEPPDVIRGALFISLYTSTTPKATFRRSLLAIEPGVYRFEHTLAAGRWRVFMRYGNGIAFRSGYLDLEIGASTMLKKTAIPFYRALAPGVPDAVQPLGYTTFAFILLLAVIAIVWVLNRQKRSLEVIA